MAQISKKIFERVAHHQKISSKYANEQVIRVLISKIRTSNPALTPDAAAHVFAKKHKVSIFRNLNDDDKKSLINFNYDAPLPTNSVLGKPLPPKRKRPLTLSYDQKLVNESEKNREIYPYVYILENSLRNLIFDKFKNESNWWANTSIVKKDIQDYATRIENAEKNHKWVGKRGNHPIYYVGLEHLEKIIDMNFNPHFKGMFDLQKMKTWIDECIPIRNLIAHNIPVKKEEQDNIKIRTKYILNSIK